MSPSMVTESIDPTEMFEVLEDFIYSGSNKEADMALWGWFEENLSESGLYPGDASTSDYLEVISEEKLIECYNYMCLKFPDLFSI